jgi:hypothetical protein
MFNSRFQPVQDVSSSKARLVKKVLTSMLTLAHGHRPGGPSLRAWRASHAQQ